MPGTGMPACSLHCNPAHIPALLRASRQPTVRLEVFCKSQRDSCPGRCSCCHQQHQAILQHLTCEFLPSPSPLANFADYLSSQAVPSVLCTAELLIQNNLTKCSWETCCFQIDIQGPSWPQTQNAGPQPQQRCIPPQSSPQPPALCSQLIKT